MEEEAEKLKELQGEAEKQMMSAKARMLYTESLRPGKCNSGLTFPF